MSDVSLWLSKRSLISSDALSEKVRQSISDAFIPEFKRCRARSTMTRVLPEPGPATMSSGLLGYSTAFCCSALSSTTKGGAAYCINAYYLRWRHPRFSSLPEMVSVFKNTPLPDSMCPIWVSCVRQVLAHLASASAELLGAVKTISNSSPP